MSSLDANARRARGEGETTGPTDSRAAPVDIVIGDFIPRRALQPAQMAPALTRRRSLQLMAAGMALAGVSGCAERQRDERIVPYIEQPDGLTPGVPLTFATAVRHAGFAQGVLAISREGRPVKLEGNPDHPASLGATDVFMQAALLSLYDPDRSQSIVNLGYPGTWDRFLGEALTALGGLSAGGGLRILTGTVTSPTLAAQIDVLLRRYPGSRWHRHEPVSRDSVYEGTRLAFGIPANPVYHFDRANVIFALDADFLTSLPGHVRYARQFSDRRRVRANSTRMNRLYAVESWPTLTGAMADQCTPVRCGNMAAVALQLAYSLGAAEAGPVDGATIPVPWLDAAARDLAMHTGAALVVAGEHQPPVVHALAHAMNQRLGAYGKTVTYTAPVELDRRAGAAPLGDLVRDMRAGHVQALLILGTNPVYDAPADLGFAEALAFAPFTAHCGVYFDETAALCRWHVPTPHELESWSDARAFDGTVTIQQPLVEPLFPTHSAHETLAELALVGSRPAHDIVRDHWSRLRAGTDFPSFWRAALRDGIVAGSAEPAVTPTLSPTLSAEIAGARIAGEPAGLELQFAPDPSIWDGSYANNGWLQELPKPLTKITWDSAALMSAATAMQLGVRSEDVVNLRHRGYSVLAPVYVADGHPDGAVTLTLGGGRARAGHVGDAVGCNAYAVRTSNALWFGRGLDVQRTGARHAFVVTHTHHTTEGRELIHITPIETFRKNPQFVRSEESSPERPTSIIPDWKYEGYAWGMVIDTNVCIGCNACVLGCQSENNIPVVGKEEVLRGREMHWIRIDRYYTGGNAKQKAAVCFEPVPCMHCEKAPCELVCPVGATVHDADGLNEMVYNRCIGTRYCSNNCPYKVRRFNFLHYSGGQPNPGNVNGNYDSPLLKLMANPQVTIRGRGVMEKCTYCVQRIQNAKIEAEKQNRRIGDGEVKTACQQACPTHAIIFGDVNDAQSEAAHLRTEPHHYSLLAELNTRPRTTYLERFTNADEQGGRREDRSAAGDGRPAFACTGHGSRAELRLDRPEDQRDGSSTARPTWVARRSGSLLPAADGASVRGNLPAYQGGGDLGNPDPRRVGVRDRKLCVVDRHRACRDAYLRDSAADEAEVAHLDQPVCGGYDAICGSLRWTLSAAASWTAVLFLLAVPISKHHVALAAVPQPACVGFFRGQHLFDRFPPVLVSGHGPGSCRIA